MAQQTINVGAAPNDGTGTPLRTAFQYTNSNFTELYTALGGGAGLPGATTQVIFNDGGTNLAGDAGLTYNKTTDALTVGGLLTAGSGSITGDLTVDTSTLKVDSGNNIVGVGVVPSSGIGNLQIGGSANASLYVQQGTDTVRAGVRATGRTGILLDSSDATYTNRAWYLDNVGSSGSLIIGRQGLDAVTFDNSGNLGLGVTPSAWSGISAKVFEFGNSGSNNSLWGNGANDLHLVSNAYFNGSNWIYNKTAAATRYNQLTGSHAWYTAPSGTAGNAITWTQAMTLDASGNLLVGTTSALNAVSGSSQVAIGGAGIQSTSQAISAATATTICRSGSGGVAIVGGYNGTGQYSAIIIFSYGTGGGVTVVSSQNNTGSTITYAISGVNVQITSSLALTNLTTTCIRTA